MRTFENKPLHSCINELSPTSKSPCIWEEDEVDLINCDDTVDRWTRLMGYVRGMEENWNGSFPDYYPSGHE